VTNKLDQASAQILRYQYDAGGRLTNRWSAAKGTTGYLYDAAGNLTKVDYPAGTTDITMAYDARNQLTNMVDAAGTTKYTYTALGELLTEDGPWASDTVTYGYHASVPRLRTSVSLQQPSGSWTQTYGYDAAKRLSTVGGTAGTHSYTYRGAGTLWTNLALPNTSRITNGYDTVGRLTQTRLRNSGGTALNTHSYVYNVGHQRTRQTRTDASYVDYTYDHIGQLRTAVGTGGQSTENLQYGYDTAWNLNKRTNGVTVHTFTVDVKNLAAAHPEVVAQLQAVPMSWTTMRLRPTDRSLIEGRVRHKNPLGPCLFSALP
jgi:YD repeat-containing protein